MDFAQNNVSANNNNGFGLQTNFLNKKPAGLNFGMKTNNNNSAYYAKKGEPMYLKEMDADEDGIISLDEFRDYCKEKGFSSNKITKMLETAVMYRTLMKDKDNKDNKGNKEIVYAKRGDGKYDEAMDTNNDDKVSYKEYIEYCKEHSQPQEHKSDTEISESGEGEFKTTSLSKAAQAYANTENGVPESRIEDTV